MTAEKREPFTPPRKAITPKRGIEVVRDRELQKMIPETGSNERFDRLVERVKVRTRDKVLGAEAVKFGAALRCQMPEGTWGTEVAVTQMIARYLAAEAAVTGRFDPRAALRRANVDRYGAEQLEFGSQSLSSFMWMLYAAGRLLHPGEFPRKARATAPRPKHVPPAETSEIERLLALVPTLSGVNGRRLQTVVDLCWGAGARRADFRYLCGSAITTRTWQDRTVALVELRNNAGGVRAVPVFDPAMVERLAALSEYSGEGLVLAPAKTVTHRNEINRVAESLREQGHRGFNPLALRHRWMLETAERLPAAIVLQLADVIDLRVISDHRRLPVYGLEYILETMSEAIR
ncbi:hypothetical protein GS440_22060 [Rhodococcus hoagii]|nr:hypothetical protein [Prescottella equi]NKS32964.1 hypothetical protein [Prescottella equi]